VWFRRRFGNETGPGGCIPMRAVVLATFIVLVIVASSFSATVTAVYDKNWQLQYYVKDMQLFDKNWLLQYYLRADRVYDKDWQLQFYLKDGQLYDKDWQLQYYLREVETSQP
jgi:hypothetical protein